MENKIKLDTIESAIKSIKKGEIIIVVDDHDRENEGDFVAAAEMITSEKINLAPVLKTLDAVEINE